MPELPEIETVKLQLQKALVGEKIVAVKVNGTKTVTGDIKAVEGKEVTGVRRMAKVLIVDLEDDLAMAFHFKMTGQLILDRDNRGETWEDRIVGGHPTEDFIGRMPSSHTRVIFELSRGVLYFNDQRMFGWIKVGPRTEIEKDKLLLSLGPEPIAITEEEFVRRLTIGSRRPIKVVIMEQSIISGVGNIYANDGLWEARIHPAVPVNSLTSGQLGGIYQGIVKVLREGIKYGGATAADAKYIDLHGLGGRYQEHFRTYDRQGEECLRKDGGVIEKTVMGGRGTYYCPVCQK